MKLSRLKSKRQQEETKLKKTLHPVSFVSAVGEKKA